MKLPTIKKILREDVKDAPGWIAGIIDPMNTFMEGVYTALNKNITLGDNIASFIKEITYKTPSGYPSDVPNVSFVNTLRTKAVGVLIMQVVDKSTYLPRATSNVAWVEDVNGIVIYPILGLEASKTYTIRFVVF